MKKENNDRKIQFTHMPTNLYVNLKDKYNLDNCPILEECSSSHRFEILTIDVELSRNEDIKAKEMYLKELAFDYEELLFNFELYKGVERSQTLEGDHFNCSNCKEEHKKHCQFVKPFEYLELGRKKIALERKRIELNKSSERQTKIKKVLYDLLKFRYEVFKSYPDIKENPLLQYFVNENNLAEENEKIRNIRNNLKISNIKLGRDNIKKNYLFGLNALNFTEKDIKKILKEMDRYLKRNFYFEPSDPE